MAIDERAEYAIGQIVSALKEDGNKALSVSRANITTTYTIPDVLAEVARRLAYEAAKTVAPVSTSGEASGGRGRDELATLIGGALGRAVVVHGISGITIAETRLLGEAVIAALLSPDGG